jgi:hypothetical protein
MYITYLYSISKELEMTQVNVVTPDVIGQLGVDEQHQQFETLKNLAKFETKTCTNQHCFYNYLTSGSHQQHQYHHQHHTIYRPIRPLPGEWQWYQKYMDDAFPHGETRSVDALAFSKDNYQLLYRWVTGACVTCGNHDYYWSEGDKHLEYYCPVCREETIFIKGAWAYM